MRKRESHDKSQLIARTYKQRKEYVFIVGKLFKIKILPLVFHLEERNAHSFYLHNFVTSKYGCRLSYDTKQIFAIMC